MSTPNGAVAAKVDAESASSIVSAELQKRVNDLELEKQNLTRENEELLDRCVKANADLELSTRINSSGQGNIDAILAQKEAAEANARKFKQDNDELNRIKAQTDMAVTMYREREKTNQEEIKRQAQQLETVRTEHLSVQDAKGRVEQELSDTKTQLQTVQQEHRTVNEEKTRIDQQFTEHRAQVDAFKQQTETKQQQHQQLVQFLQSELAKVRKSVEDVRQAADKKIASYKKISDSATKTHKSLLEKVDGYTRALSLKLQSGSDGNSAAGGPGPSFTPLANASMAASGTPTPTPAAAAGPASHSNGAPAASS